jgi:DnaK suppressor protein
MLDQSQADDLRKQLLHERGRLIQSAKDAMGFSMDRDRDRIGRDSMDESVEEAMYGTELRLKDREKFLLVKIEAALARLDDGEIDECEECEEPIGYPRLQARPVTTLCIACKEDREQSER